MWSMTITSSRFFCDSRLSPNCSSKAAKTEGPESGASCRSTGVHWTVKLCTPSRKTELWAVDRQTGHYSKCKAGPDLEGLWGFYRQSSEQGIRFSFGTSKHRPAEFCPGAKRGCECDKLIFDGM